MTPLDPLLTRPLPASQGQPRVKLLIVDDEVHILHLLTQMIEEMECFDIIPMESGIQALDRLACEPVPILITDQFMPGMKGIEFLSRVSDSYPDTIKILLTGSSDIKVAIDAINKGKIFAYLNKPIDERQLLDVLRKAYDSHWETVGKNKLLDEVQEWVKKTSIGHLQIICKVGEGGMADIYKAYDEVADRVVAIKVLRDSIHNDLNAERFKREALACERVAYPGIVRIYSKGEYEHHLYIVEEFLDGETLHSYSTSRELPVSEVCSIGIAILRTLRAIHNAGIIHRDIKPENIFVLKGATPIVGRIKLLDFGIAKLTDVPQITKSGTLEGTVEFIAPEAFTAFQNPNPASDIYAFGIILYYLLFNASPYPDKTIMEILQNKLHANLQIPPAGGEGVPSALQELIRSTTDKDKDNRLADYGAIEAVLQRFAEPE
jgi:serine/threonine protein kinase